MEDILELAKKSAAEAEVYSVSSEETEVKFEANRLKHLQTKQRASTALRLIKDGRIGYAVTTQVTDPRALVNSALETAQFGMEAKFHFPELTTYPRVSIVDTKVKSVTTEEMIKLGEELISIVRAHTPDLICDGGVSRGMSTVRIMNSRGGKADYKKTYFSLGVEGNLIQGTDMLFVGDSQSSCHPITSPKDVAKVVLEQLERAKGRAALPSKTMPVIFTPDGVANALMMPLIAAFNGKTVLEGASPIGKKLGKSVFDNKFSLWDDATVPYRPTSSPCDDEGIPSRRTPLIEQGVVSSFLYDLQTAALAKTESTGNGSRGRGGQPAPAPNAFIIAPGAATYEDMLADIKEGIIIEQLLGAEQGNILGGDFSGNVLLGYKVENGRITGRVKDTMVSGNVYHVLKDIAGVGNRARWVGGFVQAPHIYCPALSVAVKK